MLRVVRIEGKMNAAMYRLILDENLLRKSAAFLTSDCGDGSSFSRTTTLGHRAKLSMELPQNNSVTVSEWPRLGSD